MMAILSQAFFWMALLLVAVTTFFVLLIRLPFDSFYWSELLEAFWFQYGLFYLAALVCLLLAVCTGGRRIWSRWVPLTLVFLISAIGSAYILITVEQSMPWWPSGSGGHHATNDPNAIRILQHNAFWYQTDNSGVVKLLQDTPADIVALEEVDSENLAAIDKAGLDYPYRAGGSHLGLLLLSRWPIESSKVVEPYPGFPSLIAFIRLPDKRRLSVAVVHPPHATEPYTFKVQKDVFDSLVTMKDELTPPLILLGDVNATPFNETLIRFKEKMALKNPRLGQGYLSTWPSYMPWFFRIPIDHILISSELQPVSLELLRNTGSDHLPLYLTVK